MLVVASTTVPSTVPTTGPSTVPTTVPSTVPTAVGVSNAAATLVAGLLLIIPVLVQDECVPTCHCNADIPALAGDAEGLLRALLIGAFKEDWDEMYRLLPMCHWIGVVAVLACGLCLLLPPALSPFVAACAVVHLRAVLSLVERCWIIPAHNT